MNYQALLLHYKHKLNMHYAIRNSNNLDHGYISYLENKIVELEKFITAHNELRKVG